PVPDNASLYLVVRYGGEEFLILLPETELTNAYEVAERVRKTIVKEMRITVSLGVSAYQQGMKKEDLINKVDEALYQAKKGGRNQVRKNA
ncbi:MAG: GGDEF domain-containing protein, partial [Deltaproteobacteria bacterium]|nr:GGDEF domain-containing protein [Deltaproteobacteria bacterium]